jgi:hypothetical protein
MFSKYLFLIFLFLASELFGKTAEELLKPNTNAIDFTLNNSTNSNEYKPEKYVNKIEMEVEKVLGYIPRSFKTFTCNNDIYGNTYCPSDLAKADDYWDYDNGYSVAGVGEVTDYTSKVSSIETINATYNAPTYGWKWYSGRSSPSSGQKDANGFMIFNDYKVGTSGGCYFYTSMYGSYIAKKHTNGEVIPANTIVGIAVVAPQSADETQYIVCRLYSSGSYSCPSGHALSGSTCVKQTLSCPSGYTETTGVETSKGQCKKVHTYTYYDYLCNTSLNDQNISFTPSDSGGNCNKTDTNNSAINNELSNSCNSSVPPTNNCKRLGYRCNQNVAKPAFIDGEWKCSPYYCNSDMKCGYASCQGYYSSADTYMSSSLNPLKSEVKLSNSSCNTSYEYIDGNSTVHYIKNCLTGEIENAICLERDTNNKCIKFDTTNPTAKCKLSNTTIEPTEQYTYYTYTCLNEKNNFGFNWEIIENITTDPGCIDDTFGGCLNFDKISNNCKRKTLGCTTGNCEFDNDVSQWKCVTGTVSLKSSSCTSQICDLVLNSDISYCLNETCPKVNGVYEKNNSCYMLYCPDGSFEVNGKCVDQ